MNIRESFDISIQENQQLIVKMMKCIQEIYVAMFDVIKSNDLDGAERLINDDILVNEMEETINEQAYLVVLKQCPVASDLRKLVTSIKVANELERVADYAANIGVYIQKTTQNNESYRKLMLNYRQPLLDMFTVLIEAYNESDVKKAFKVCALDNDIDIIYEQQIKQFIAITREKTQIVAEEASRALLVIKQFERAGDHLTNIAEHIIFLRTGKHVTLN